MRILIVGPSNRFQSGISTYTIRLANALDEAGHDVSVIAFRKLLPQFLFPGAKRVGKDLSTLTFRGDVHVFDEMDYNDPFSWRAATRFLDRERPDAIILQWWTSSAAHMHLRIKRAAQRLGIPVYVEMHEVVDTLEQRIYPIAKYAKMMGPRVLRGNAGYITHSESDKKLVTDAYALDPRAVTVIPHGNYDHFGPAVDPKDARATLGIEEEYVFLYFGLIREYKGVPTLVAAFERLPPEVRDRSRLLLVGEIWENKAETLERIRGSSAASNITLVDRYVPDSEVATFFGAADSVVLPYTRASQSGVAHIAISYGKPLLVSRVGGLVEALAEYPECTFVEPDDPQDLMEAMAMRAAARTIGAPRAPPSKTSWDAIAKRVTTVVSRSGEAT